MIPFEPQPVYTGPVWRIIRASRGCSHGLMSSGMMRGPPQFRACGRAREAGTACDVDGRARYPRGADDCKAPRGAFCFWWALRPIFVWRGAAGATGGEAIVTGTLRERLIALIEPLIQRLGYELVELEYS